ncbi:transglycosylase family protein [Promicromonospora soli]
MTSPHPAQGIPSDQPINLEADASVGITELSGPPPSADEAFPAAVTAAAGPQAGPPSGAPPAAAVAPTAVTAAVPAQSPPPQQSTPPPRRHRGAALLAGAAAVAVVGAGGITAYASAHKSITLDVDGKVTTVETYQGDVADLLVDEGVEVTNRDAVTPGADGALRDGGMVVVRYGHHVTFRTDGVRRTAWVTALDADQALATLSRRAGDVALVPSRSGGRVTLPMRLDADSPVNLVVGGKTQRVSDGAAALDDLLADNGVTVDADDRVTVERGQSAGPPTVDPGVPTLTVVVKKVETSVERTVTRLPFDKVTAQDPDRFEDLDPYLATEGVAGKRVTSWDVTRVDGKVVDRDKLSSTVKRKPVDQVVMYGTKARPAPEPEPAPAPQEAVEPVSLGAVEPEPEPDDGAAVTGDVWAALAKCESGGDPTTNTGNGYYGLYQFSLPTWEAMGGSGLPSDASAAEQTMRAQALQQQSGWGQWPACAASLGLY